MWKSGRLLNSIWIAGLFMMSASTTSRLSESYGTSTRYNPQTDSVFVSIVAHDLSEDMSRILSTKNDELLVFIYTYRDSNTLEAPIFQQAFTVKETEKTYTFYFDKANANSGSNLLFLVIEQDFDRPIEQIDPVIRVQHQALLRAFKDRDYQKIKRFLGNEDLLGYLLINSYRPEVPISFKIEGVHKLDYYDYTVEIKRR